jgi:hypothetical protein
VQSVIESPTTDITINNMFIELSLVVFAFVRSSKEMLKDWTQPTVIFEESSRPTSRAASPARRASRSTTAPSS